MYNIHGYEKVVRLTKGSRKVVFYIVINTPNVELLCTYFRKNSDNVEAAMDGTKPNISIHIAQAIFGHMD